MNVLQDNLEFFDEDVRGLQATLREELDNIQDKRLKERGKIVCVTALMKATIQQAEESLVAQNEQLFTKYEAGLKRSLETTNQMINEVASIRSQADDVMTNGVEDHVTEENLKCKYDSLQERLITLQKASEAPLFKQVDEDLEVVKSMDIGLFEKTEYLNPSVSDKQSVMFSSQREIDLNPCFPTALLWVNDMIIVSDKGNKKLKFFSETGTFLSELLFTNAAPYGACHVKENSFAVTLPRIKHIYIVRLDGQTAKPLSNFHTFMGYSGLCKGMRPGSLIATVASNTPGESQVDIIGFQGEIFLSFKNDAQLGVPLFKFPRYVVANEGVLIISDWRKNCVIFLHEGTGSVLKEYKGTPENPLVNPYGVSLDDSGSVYIMCGKDDSIHVLDVQCNLVEVIKGTTQLISPRLIAYDSSSGRLAVSYGAGDIKSYHHRVPFKVSEHPVAPPPHSPSGLLQPKDDAHLRCPSPGF